jgi:SAM-dependent methyltransferase
MTTDAVGGMNPDNFALLHAQEAGNFWFEPRNKLIVGLLDRYFPNARSFMEVGCGTGFVLSAISKSRRWERLYGSELHEEGLDFAKARLKGAANLIQMDARNIPVEYSDLDTIGAFDVIEHIPEDEAVLRGMQEALKPGGGLLIAVPQHQWLWSDVDDISCHVRRYSGRELKEKVERAGFRVLFSGSYSTALLPLMMLSRLKAKRGAETSAAEFSLPKPINAGFRGILHAEVMLTLAGVRFPVGGSRVMVAQKR